MQNDPTPQKRDHLHLEQGDGGLLVRYLGVEVIIAKRGRGQQVVIVNCDEDKTDIEVNGDEIPSAADRLLANIADPYLGALKAVDEAWDAWMTHEEGEGQEDMEQAIANLREVLRNA